MAHAHIPVVPLAHRWAYSPAEVAALTGLSPAFVADLIKSGALRSTKIGGRRIIAARALKELLGETPDAIPNTAPHQAPLHAAPSSSASRP
jgi:excisionase family DNA binding protein